MAFGALAFNEAVWQKHVLLGVEELLNDLRFDQVRLFEIAINLARQFMVLRRIGAVPVVKTDMKTIQIRFATRGDVGHELLRRFASLFSGNHDRCAVGIIRTHKIDIVALHLVKTHPDIGLDVLHDVPDVEVAVGIGQGGGNEKLAGHGADYFQVSGQF